MLKVLITGGSGFIGTNLVDSLLGDGYTVLNIDVARPVKTEHLKHWAQVDILNLADLRKAVAVFQPHMMVHMAAVTDLNGKDLTYYRANIEGTRNLITAANDTPGLQKVVFTSSMYVCQPGFIPPDFDTYRPHTIYGESKVETERLVKANHGGHYSWVIIRPTSIWGPWFNVPYIDFFKIVHRRKYFDFGKACTKTYGYVGNTIFQIRKLMDSDQVHGKTFYLGDDPAIQISDWANEISIHMGKGATRKIPFSLLKSAAVVGDVLSFLRINFPVTSFRLTNMTTNNILPLQNLYEIAGTPPYNRSEGIQETVNWLREAQKL